MAILLLIGVCIAPAWAADKQLSAAEKAQAAKMAKVDAVAKQAFTLADHNHNDILSRTEFPDAEEYLEEGLMQLGNQGVLGVVPKGQAVPQNPDTKAMAGASTNLYKKKTVSLSEFQLFARAMGTQADVVMAQNRAAYQAYMQQMQKSRGRGHRQVHTGTPIFIGP
jgi:hypothetical protein